MREIRILTYWGVANYGAWTQAYALNNVIREITGNTADVKHLDYLEISHYNMYYQSDERLHNSFSYSWNEIPHTKHYTEVEIEQTSFDTLITGSDSIWTFENIPIKPDYHLIGYNLNVDNLISYAASAGVDTVNDKYINEIQVGLNAYSHISVRDRNTFDIVKHYVDSETEIVLDPALLWNFKNDPNILKPSYDNYIAVYGTKWDSKFIEKTLFFAKKKGLKLISIGYVNDWCDISLKMVELRGCEWIGMFSQASYIVTSTFHGLMVGLNYEKQIKFCQSSFVKNRSQTLIDELNIPDFDAEYDCELDYSIISPKIANLKMRSIEFLQRAIGVFGN